MTTLTNFMDYDKNLSTTGFDKEKVPIMTFNYWIYPLP